MLAIRIVERRTAILADRRLDRLQSRQRDGNGDRRARKRKSLGDHSFESLRRYQSFVQPVAGIVALLARKLLVSVQYRGKHRERCPLLSQPLAELRPIKRAGHELLIAAALQNAISEPILKGRVHDLPHRAD